MEILSRAASDFVVPLKCQQNASRSKPDSSLGTRESRKEPGQANSGCGTKPTFCF